MVPQKINSCELQIFGVKLQVGVVETRRVFFSFTTAPPQSRMDLRDWKKTETEEINRVFQRRALTESCFPAQFCGNEKGGFVCECVRVYISVCLRTLHLYTAFVLRTKRTNEHLLHVM